MRNFYEHQSTATSKSRRQVFWLTFAVLGTAVVTSMVLVYLVLLGCSGMKIETAGGIVDLSEHLRSKPAAVELLFAGTSLLVAICIAGKSYWKVKQLRSGGGAVIAEDLGGTEIEETPQLDLKSRQLLNVVQEIAISASIPPPPVYCMRNEVAINAFAAGYTPHDAIICVTRGCLRELNREQLQGVIAHEFSHILNGDMRQNIRTIGVLHGVLFVIEAAEASWHTAAAMWDSSDISGASVKLSIAMLIAAAFLWPVGMVGLFFATIAKAGISRQREYLADATAVELSRNPNGIAHALKRIAGFGKGTRVRSPMAIEASHLFFANGMAFNNLLSTHPPIVDRILRLDPNWDGVPEYGEQTYEEYAGIYEGTMNFSAAPTTDAVFRQDQPQPDSKVTSTDGSDHETSPSLFAAADAKENAHRHDIMARLPAGLVDVVRDPMAAGATVIALRSVAPEPTQCCHELQQIVDALNETLGDLALDQRLLLLDEAINTLADQPADPALLSEFERLAIQPADSLYEFAWNSMVSRLTCDLRREAGPKPKFANLRRAETACSIVVSALVHAGGNLGPAGDYAFRRGAVHLDLPTAHYLHPEECTVADLDAAAETLRLAAPTAKRLVCKTVSACITADSEVSDEEALVVRGVISKLGFPIPQVLPGHPVTPGA